MLDDLNSFALRLLKFAEDNIEESVSNSSSRLDLLTEADGAIAVLKRTLHRGDEKKLFQLMLLGVFDSDFKSLANEDKPELSLKPWLTQTRYPPKAECLRGATHYDGFEAILAGVFLLAVAGEVAKKTFRDFHAGASHQIFS